MTVADYDDDGHPDVLINGNDYGTEVSIRRYNAMNGLLLKGDGKGGFAPVSILQSGIYIPGNGKALVQLAGASGNTLVAASQGLGELKLFALREKGIPIRIRPTDAFAEIKFRDGSTEKIEFHFGNSFLSQSSRYFSVSNKASSVEITNLQGQKRTVKPGEN